MTYLSAKKIYPGNWAEALNGWYRNIDTSQNGTNDASNAGPTSVLAQPGWRFFQQRGYVEVANSSGDGVIAEASVIVPSPTRTIPLVPTSPGCMFLVLKNFLATATVPPFRLLLVGMALLLLVCTAAAVK